MNTIFSVFADAMLFISLPLFGGLGYWEEHLVLSKIERILMQILLLIIVFMWVWFWYSLGENERLTHTEISKPYFSFDTTRIENLDSSVENTSEKAVPFAIQKLNNESFDEMKRRPYVSSH